MKKECRCKKCIECCWHNPGWFGNIEEIKNAAIIKKLSVQEFCQEYLIREWWSGESEIEVPAPRRNFEKRNDDVSDEIAKRVWSDEVIQNGKGFVKASWGHNLITGYACIFLDKNNICTIHNSKPQECRESFRCQKSKFEGRQIVVEYWENHQEFIKQMTPNLPY